MASKPTFASVIKNRGFRYLWLNQILVQLSYNAINFALLVWVYKLTGSVFAVAGLLTAVYLPALFFGLFAGFLVDKADRRKLIIVLDLLFAIGFLLFIPIKAVYPLILLNAFFINSLSQFFMPAESSSIPLLLNKKQLFLGNSLFSLTLYGSFMIGFSLAGPVLSIFGINEIFIFAALNMALAFILAQNLPAIRSKASGLREFLTSNNLSQIMEEAVEETKLTIQTIRGKLNVVTSIALLAAVQGVVGILAITFSPYMETVLKIHATDASYVLMVPLGLGMIVGAYLMGRFAINLPKRLLVIPAVIISGIIFMLAGATPLIAQMMQAVDLPSYLTRPRFFFRAPSLSLLFGIGSFILGLCTVVIIVTGQTVIQENTSAQIRGKVFAVLGVLMNAIAFIPVLLVGILSDFFGVTSVLFSVGVLILLVGLFARRPALFFAKTHLPYRVREFLGLGHWENGS